MGFSAGNEEEVRLEPPRAIKAAQTPLSFGLMEDAIERLMATKDEEEEECESLPREISRAAAEGNELVVLEWLGLPPVPPSRINAKYNGRTLLHEAVGGNQRALISNLLQLGANVDSKNALGLTPLEQTFHQRNSEDTARLLLTWGATAADPSKVATTTDNLELVHLLQAPLGGRRCEIVDLEECQHFNGKTGVVTRYVATEQLYVFQIEETDEIFTIQPVNLRQRNRTPKDCGTGFRFPQIAPRPSLDPMEEWGIFPAPSAQMMPNFDGIGMPELPELDDELDPPKARPLLLSLSLEIERTRDSWGLHSDLDWQVVNGCRTGDDMV